MSGLGMPQFWSCEVRCGEESLVDVMEGEEVVQVTQVALGGDASTKGARVVLSVEVDGVKAVIGTLQHEVCEQFACDLVLPTGCTLSHSGPKGASVHLIGTRNTMEDEGDGGEGYDSEYDSEYDSDEDGDGDAAYEFSTQSDSSEEGSEEEDAGRGQTAAQPARGAKQLKGPPPRRGDSSSPSSSSGEEEEDEEEEEEEDNADFSSGDDTDTLADVASRYMGPNGLYEEMGLLGSDEDDEDEEDQSDDDEGVDDFDVDGQDDEDLDDDDDDDESSGLSLSESGDDSDASSSELDTDNDVPKAKQPKKAVPKAGEKGQKGGEDRVVVDGRVMGEVDTDDDEEIDSDDFSDDSSGGGGGDSSSPDSSDGEKEEPLAPAVKGGKRKPPPAKAAPAPAAKAQKVEKPVTPKTRAGKAAAQAKPPSTPANSSGSLHDEFEKQIVGLLQSKGKVAFAALGSQVKKPKGTPKVKQFCLSRPDVFKIEDDKFVSLV